MKLFLLFLFFIQSLTDLRGEIIPHPFNPKEPLNSTQDDFGGSLTEDGKTIVFNSKRDNQKYQDLYISNYNEGAWSIPRPMNELNSDYNDETPYISADGKTILFSSDRDGSREYRDERGRILVSFDIYISTNVDGKWTKPFPIPGMVNSIQHERAPSLSPDGTTLYYTEYPFGKSDSSRIMEAELTSRGFSRGKPMPAPINTGNMERALIEASDGYYFSSARPGGYGEWDIYFVPKGNNVKAVNLGPLINTEKSEFYYNKKSYSAYFCSNRKESIGRFDIFKASFDIPAAYFGFNSSIINVGAASILNEIADFLKKNDTAYFEITGHTDLHGDSNYNLKLSENRAKAVKNFMVAKGLPSGRFKVRGAGMTEPVKKGTGPGFDELNRRTEFVMLGFKP